jgi:hypothetical protein
MHPLLLGMRGSWPRTRSCELPALVSGGQEGNRFSGESAAGAWNICSPQAPSATGKGRLRRKNIQVGRNTAKVAPFLVAINIRPRA